MKLAPRHPPGRWVWPPRPASARSCLPSLAGALADRRRRHRLRRARRSRSSSRRCWLLVLAVALVARSSSARAAGDAGRRGGAGGHRHRARRAAVRRARRRPPRLVAGPDRRRPSRARSPAPCRAASSLASARASPRLDAEARRRAAVLRRGRRPGRRRARASCSRRWRSSRSASSSRCWPRPPPRGREVRRPAHPAVDRGRMKLLLAVIDGMKPSMLERAIERGEAPALKAIRERGTLRRRAVRRVPVGDAGLRGVDRHRRPAGPPPHPAMNWYSRDERRYVEYGSSFRASRKLGIARQLTDTVFNMNGQPPGGRRRRRSSSRSTTPACAPRARPTSSTAAATSTRCRRRPR